MNNSFAMPGLNSDLENFFNFEEASSNTLWPGTHNNLAQQTQTVQAEEQIQVMPLTKAEIEAILALRASKAQNHNREFTVAPLEPNNNFSVFQESNTHGADLDYYRAESLIPTNFDNLEIPNYYFETLNTSDGFEAFKETRPEVLGESFGAPMVVDQLG
jgi:hypothetical protein